MSAGGVRRRERARTQRGHVVEAIKTALRRSPPEAPSAIHGHFVRCSARLPPGLSLFLSVTHSGPGGGLTGVLITIEGVEGAGKSTQIQLLETRLRGAGASFLVTKEPGGTSLGKDLRSLLLSPHASGERWCPEAELLLFYADRAQHLTTVVRPALADGKIVVVDRFEDSTRAYQGAQGVDDARLDRLSELVLAGLRTDLTLVLNMDPEESLRRVQARNAGLGADFKETRFDNEALSFHRRVRDRFLDIAKGDPQRVVLIAADQPAQQVETTIWEHVAPLLRRHGHHV